MISTPAEIEVPSPRREISGFCPACGEPAKSDILSHDDDCPFRGDDLSPEEGNY